MKTLTDLRENRETEVTPPLGRINSTQYVIDKLYEQRLMVVAGKPEIGRRIDLAIGSGKFGLSYLHLDLDGMERLRMSYLPPYRKWYVHPGDQHANLYDPPGKFGKDDSRSCLSCHSTTQPPTGYLPQERFFGVGCESCHGPGSTHVEAARTKRADLLVAKLGKVGAETLTHICGRCHSKPGAPDEPLVDPKETRRYAANALMQSRCYIQSGNRLSCVTCHDPHADAATDALHYDRICLSCHAPNLPANVPGRGNHCKSNRTSMCTSCHMPKGKFEPGLDIPTLMTDHYIRPPSTLRLPVQK